MSDRVEPRVTHSRTFTRNFEFNVAVFALLLNFPWEILQAPLFIGMADGPFVDAIKGCSQGTLGDAVIMLSAYWMVSGIARSRDWIFAPSGKQLTLFVAIGVLITAVIEWLATRGYWVQSWTYSPAMPVVPGIGVGISPLLQWIILPLLLVWFVRRQLGGGFFAPSSGGAKKSV